MVASSLVVKFPAGQVTARSSKEGRLGCSSTREVQNACFWA